MSGTWMLPFCFSFFLRFFLYSLASLRFCSFRSAQLASIGCKPQRYLVLSHMCFFSLVYFTFLFHTIQSTQPYALVSHPFMRPFGQFNHFIKIGGIIYVAYICEKTILIILFTSLQPCPFQLDPPETMHLLTCRFISGGQEMIN